MRLSRRMKELLKWLYGIHLRFGATTRRPFHTDNLRTHEAVLRRGLIYETMTAQGLETRLTKTGADVAAWLIKVNQEEV